MNASVETYLLSLALAAVPPLSADHAARLGGAVDGADQHDEAFLALVEHVRTWTAGPGDAPIRLHPDLEAMSAKPADYRGELCRITGTLQQSTQLAPPFDSVVEWFVRVADSRAAIVYLVG